ncbi:MAG: hypothetical protein HZC36_15600 [Armatimonadetes bacterium]|nr:hypothetical protein [Armatimonadota bacterium]
MKEHLDSRPIAFAGLAALAGLCLCACGRIHIEPEPRAKFVSPKDLGVDTPPPSAALLQLAGGEPLEVTVRANRDGAKLQLELIAHREVIETETYSTTPTSFNLVEAAGETYEPILPLLKFPMNLGDQWSWTGQIVLSSASIPAEAVITAANAPLGLEGYPLEAVQVSVTLEIGDPRARAAKRTLNFWVAPGYGVLKREFGLSSSRSPAPKPVEGAPVKAGK